MPKNLANLLVEVYDTYPTALTVPRYADYPIKVSSRTVRRNHVGELIMSSGWTSLSASRGRVIVAIHRSHEFHSFLVINFHRFPAASKKQRQVYPFCGNRRHISQGQKIFQISRKIRFSSLDLSRRDPLAH